MSSNPRAPYEMASDRRRLPPPQPGKPLIVHVIVNVEYWPFDQPMPRKLISRPARQREDPRRAKLLLGRIRDAHGLSAHPRALTRRELPASTTINASVIDVYPRVALAPSRGNFMG